MRLSPDGFIIKLHGDYLDPRIRNTVAELEAYAPELDQLLDRVFDEFGLIISGWSGEWDVALRAAMERCPTRRFSCLWGEPGTLGAKAANLIALRSIQLVQGLGADQLFARLEEQGRRPACFRVRSRLPYRTLGAKYR